MSRPDSERRRRYRRQVAARDGARCFYCRHRFADPVTEATLDHLVPTAHGGTWARANLVLACYPCNQAKADRLPTEFLRPSGFRPGLRPRPTAVLRQRLTTLTRDRFASLRTVLADGVRSVRSDRKAAVRSGIGPVRKASNPPVQADRPRGPFRVLLRTVPVLLVLGWAVTTVPTRTGRTTPPAAPAQRTVRMTRVHFEKG